MVLEFFSILTVIMDTQTYIDDKSIAFNTHTPTRTVKLGNLNEISELYEGKYPRCHIIFWFCKILPLGQTGHSL